MIKTKELNSDIKNINQSILLLSQIEDENEKVVLRHQLHKEYRSLNEEDKQKLRQDFIQMQESLLTEAKQVLKT